MMFGRRNRDLEDEIAAHVRMALRDRLDRGEPYEEAMRAIRREFGNEAAVKEVTRAAWGWTWLETLVSDLRYAARGIAKSPAWAAAAAVSLALGVGANTAIFSLTYAIVLKRLPVPEPSRLIRYAFRNGAQEIGLSGPLYDALSRRQTASTGLLAWSNAEFSLEENGRVERLHGALLSGTGFRVLDLQPMLGSIFGDADDVPGGGPRGYQAVLSYAWWKSRFDESPSVIGRTLRLNGRAVTICGVLPPGFDGLIAGDAASVILPLAFDEVLHAPQPMRKMAGALWLSVFGRLKPGQSIASARANLAAIEPEARKEADPQRIFLFGFFKPFHVAVEDGSSGRSLLRTAYERPLMILEMLAVLALALCCANTALLVLAQMSGRARQFALRTALGAPRLRLFRLALLEILMLAAAGLILASGLGWGLARSLTAMLAGIGSAPSIDVAPHAAILAFTAVATLAAALGSGLLPAIRISRADPAGALKQGSPGATSRRPAGAWIVPAQVAVSVTLIASALLLGATFRRLYLNDSGFRPEGLLLADVDLHPAKLTDEQRAQAIPRMISELTSTPGIETAAYLSMPPIHDWWSSGHYFAVDPSGAVHTDMTTWTEEISSEYFAAMGTRLLQGELFPKEALATDRTCVLSENAARYFFPSGSAVGQLVYSASSQPETDGAHLNPEDACRVIGVVENARFRSLREPPPRMIYKILAGKDAGALFSVAMRAHSERQAAAALRDSVRRIAPTAPAPTLYSFAGLMDAHLNKERMLIRLSASFAGCALLLTAVGLFGLLMRNVSERTREIGIRMALGANRSSAVASVLKAALRYVVIGLAVGGAMAFAVARAMSSLLYGVSPHDPKVFAASAAVLALTALIATLIPARRAAAVDPAEALRVE